MLFLLQIIPKPNEKKQYFERANKDRQDSQDHQDL